MSTTGGSEQGTVYVLDEPKAIEKKIKSAVTDSGSEVRRGPEKAGIGNLIEILAAVRGSDPEQIESEFARGALRRVQGRGRRGRRRVPGAGARALRGAARRRGRPGGGAGGRRRQGARDRRGDAADVRERMGVGAPSGA